MSLVTLIQQCFKVGPNGKNLAPLRNEKVLAPKPAAGAGHTERFMHQTFRFFSHAGGRSAGGVAR